MARPWHTAEFKRAAVRLAPGPGLSRRAAAKPLGIHPNVLAGWVEKLKQGNWNEEPGSELKREQTRELERP